MWKSTVVWPDEVNTDNISEHDIQGQALAVCDTIQREGLGDERKIFPYDL